jgi:hypothetical protein
MASRPRSTGTLCQSLLALTAVLSLSFCILPASLAAATAKRDRARPTAGTPAAGGQVTATKPAGAGSGSTSQSCCSASPPRTPAAQAKRRERAAAGRPAASSPGQLRAAAGGEGAGAAARPCCASSPQPGPAASSQRRREAARAGRRERHRRNARGPAEGPASEGAGEAEAEAPAAASPMARQRERQKGKHHKAKETKRPRRVPPPAPEAKPVPKLATTSITFGPTAAAPVAAPAKPVAPTTPQLVGGRPQSPSSAVLSAGARRAARSGRLAGAGPLTPAALAIGGVPLATPAGANAGNPAPAPAAKKHAQPAPSQLVTTVTKIINVIPLSMRFVIAALVALALVLGISSRLASARAGRLARQRRQLLDDVGLLQAALLPPTPARLGPVATSSAYRPASGPGAGGDFYDVFALADGQLAVIVGDVSGHGRTALPQTTLVRYTLRAYLEAGMSPRGALKMAAPVLERQLGESFATVVLATYHPRDRTLVYACAGHPPPLIVGSESVAPVTACSAPPIGAGQPTGTRQTVVSLPGEALVCFYTDGVLDSRVRGELFGAARAKRALMELGSEASASSLLDRVAEETDQRPDDMAACLLRLEGDQRPPSARIEEVELDRLEVTRDRAARLLLAHGVDPAEVERVMASARSAVARDGAVVLELYVGEQPPEVALRPQNVAPFEPTIRASSRALEMSG